MAIRDGDFELLEHDFQTGRTVWRMFDGEKYVFRVDYNVEKTLQQNAALRAENHGKRWEGGRHVASIPANVFYDQLSEASDAQDDRYIQKWLNNSENAAFRTFEGNV